MKMTNLATLRVNGIRSFTNKTTGDVAVTVDLNMIAHNLGSRALRNKSGRARYLNGAVIVRAINRRPIE